MRIGLFTEGRPDQAVLENIVEGVLGDDAYTIPQRPKLLSDETDIALRNEAALGGLSRIKKDCEEKILLDQFFAIAKEEDFIIIQTDTAEIEEFGVVRPSKKDADYVQTLRNNTIQKIQEWLGEDFDETVVYAIAIEELEAWLLPLYEKRDSSKSMSPKEKLHRLLAKGNKSTKENYENYLKLSRPFTKSKNLAACQRFNASLRYFVADLDLKLLKSP